MSIPFSRFEGRLKQLETDFKFPIMRDLFDATFSAFEGLDETHAALQEMGIKGIITAAGTQLNTGRRPRRFAGDKDLPSGRYFTLCADDTFNDYGTLRDEMFGYFRGVRGVDVHIYDPDVDTEIFAGLQEMGMFSADDLRTPLYLFVYDIPRRTRGNEHLLDRYREHLAVGKKFAITYGIRPFVATIDNIIDLRDPNTQEWFVKTFVGMELANEGPAAEETRMVFPPKKRLTSFAELLPVIASLETGGGMVFGQAVGTWLRQQGTNGLIFPSARANAQCRVRYGKVTEFRGWNMVLYKDAPPPTHPNLFGRATTWLDRDHEHIRVNHTSAGAERGSFSIRGPKEWTLLNFDVERRVARGQIDADSPGFQIGAMVGTTNMAITNRTKEFLDLDATHDRLWYRDVDTTWFVSTNETCWRGPNDAQ